MDRETFSDGQPLNPDGHGEKQWFPEELEQVFQTEGIGNARVPGRTE